MNILQRLREKYLPYHDNLLDPPKDPIILDWKDYMEYLELLTPDQRQELFKGFSVLYKGIPVVLDIHAERYPEPGD